MSGTGRRKTARSTSPRARRCSSKAALQLDSWDDKETGQKRSRLKVRADRVQFLSGPRRDGAVRDTPPPAAGGSGGGGADSFDEPLAKSADDEEIPF